jgi:hypothetical protein
MDTESQANNLFPSQGKATQRSVLPTAVANAAFGQNFIQNSSTQIGGPISLSNGSSLTIMSIITANANPLIRLGALPFALVFFQGSLNTNNMIGVTITGNGYLLKGPFAMPNFSPHAMSTPKTYGGSDGSNLVFMTELYNATGSAQTIYYITNTRYIQPGGASS